VSGEHLSNRWKTFLSLAEADRQGSVTDGYAVNGGNCAIRRHVLLDIGESLDSSEAALAVGDCLVTERVLDVGLAASFDPAFKVYHKISRERLKILWILRRTLWEGISEIRVFRSRDLPLPTHYGRFSFIPPVDDTSAIPEAAKSDGIIPYHFN
jgi:GT2 family glycosyltransferase